METKDETYDYSVQNPKNTKDQNEKGKQNPKFFVFPILPSNCHERQRQNVVRVDKETFNQLTGYQILYIYK